MVYHKHDSTESTGYDSNNYESHAFFEEDELKYSSAKYDSNDPFSGGYKAREGEEDKNKEEMTEFEKHLEEEQEKSISNEVDDEMIKKRAAEEINREVIQLNEKEVENKKKNRSNIEEAIENAIKEEKEIVHLDY